MRVRYLRAIGRLLAGLCLGLLSGPLHAQEWIYTARPGDNLWNLSKQYLQRGVADVRRLQQYNDIRQPNRLPPGTRIRVPTEWLKTQPAPARLVQVSGEVTHIDAASGQSRRADADSLLAAGDRLLTSDDSSAIVEFADGSRLLIAAGTEISMDTLSAFAGSGMVDTRMRLHGGRTESKVNPNPEGGSRYEIITPPAVAAVRGTEFRLAYEAETNTARSEVTEGSISVSSGGVVQEVKEGFAIVAELGKPLAEPRPLLPAPDLSGLPTRFDAAPLRFQWPAVDAATSYRVQLFGGERGEALLYEEAGSEPVYVRVSLPPDGTYELRVRAIDPDAIEGLSASHAFSVATRPQPPRPRTTDGAPPLRLGDALDLAWDTDPSAVSHRLQLAADMQFEQILVDRDRLLQPNLGLQPALPAGTYYWRVDSVDASGDRSGFSAPAQLRIIAPQQAPVLDTTIVDSDRLKLRWQAGTAGLRYQVQVADDPAFERLIGEYETDQIELDIERPAAGAVYLRLRSIDELGDTSDYSLTRSLELEEPTPWWILLIVFLPNLII